MSAAGGKALTIEWRYQAITRFDCCSVSVTAIYRQLTRLPSSWRLGLLPVCRQTIQNRRIRVRRAAQAIIARTYGTRPWHETRPL